MDWISARVESYRVVFNLFVSCMPGWFQMEPYKNMISERRQEVALPTNRSVSTERSWSHFTCEIAYHRDFER